MVGDVHGVLGFYELDDADSNATVHITSFEGAEGKGTAQRTANVYTHMRAYRESDADALRALPKRLRGYQWAKDVSYAVASYSWSIAFCCWVGLADWQGDKLYPSAATRYEVDGTETE
jgi:hypothetical protein